MSLSSFSSLLNFAIKQQKDALCFFDASAKGPSAENKEFFEKLRVEAEKNIKNLETILRENISEIVMEPLEELQEEDYAPRIEGLDAMQTAAAILDKQKIFFQDAARVINLKEVKRLFEKLARR